MTADLASRLRVALDEAEWWARESSRSYGQYTEGGEHWQWEDPDTDQPVGINVHDEAVNEGRRATLRSVEKYPTDSVGPLSHSVIYNAEELEPAVAEHIALHDPAAVLRMVTAHRRIVELHAPAPVQEYGETVCQRCVWTGDDEDRGGNRYRYREHEEYPCDTLRALAEGYGITDDTPR